MRILLYLLVLSLAAHIGAESSFAQDGKATPRVEIKKFRFRRHNKKNFERLVIEFGDRDGAQPVITTVPTLNGKEANIQIERVALVGAIPEALINESYVSRSKFLGPVSINTDGPVRGFVIRTFLKEPVNVDAFWLTKPGRLVLDVFPANSGRVSGRVPESEFREVASYRPSSNFSSAPVKEDPNQIVCYPIAAAVSATVSFHSKMTSGPSVDAVPYGAATGQPGPEPVICFMASSQVVASVSFKPKSFDPNSYVQWEPRFPQSPQMAQPQMMPPPVMNVPPPPTPPLPPSGATPNTAPPVANGKAPGPGVVISDIQPGRTPLGWPLVSPSAVQRLPSSNSQTPPKLPSFGDGAPPTTATGAPQASSPSLLPPVK